MIMKRIVIALCAAWMLVSCGSKEAQLMRRAEELCAYIPDHTLLERSREYMTEDFYAVLDTMFYRLPSHEAMDHEWLYYFVTGNGGTIADYEVSGVVQTDATHAVATILVRQVWEDGLIGSEDSEAEEHTMLMERVGGEWLMSDFDGHKADCIRYIANNKREQALRDAISDYLVREIGSFYRQGELCVPTLMMVHESDTLVFGDYWLFWYNRCGDTLKTVSGGNHSGRMTICYSDGVPQVVAFEQTLDGAQNEPSARRIFGSYYDIYHNMHSNESVREAVRQEQLGDYVRRYAIPVHYYQDFGWPAVEI